MSSYFKDANTIKSALKKPSNLLNKDFWNQASSSRQRQRVAFDKAYGYAKEQFNRVNNKRKDYFERHIVDLPNGRRRWIRNEDLPNQPEQQQMPARRAARSRSRSRRRPTKQYKKGKSKTRTRSRKQSKVVVHNGLYNLPIAVKYKPSMNKKYIQATKQKFIYKVNGTIASAATQGKQCYVPFGAP